MVLLLFCTIVVEFLSIVSVCCTVQCYIEIYDIINVHLYSVLGLFP